MDSLFTTFPENHTGQQVGVEFLHTLIEHCQLTSLEFSLEGLLVCLFPFAGTLLLLMMVNLLLIQALQMMPRRHICNPPSIATFPSHSCTCALDGLKSSSNKGRAS
jgi:hypothetical protein